MGERAAPSQIQILKPCKVEGCLLSGPMQLSHRASVRQPTLARRGAAPTQGTLTGVPDSVVKTPMLLAVTLDCDTSGGATSPRVSFCSKIRLHCTAQEIVLSCQSHK